MDFFPCKEDLFFISLFYKSFAWKKRRKYQFTEECAFAFHIAVRPWWFLSRATGVVARCSRMALLKRALCSALKSWNTWTGWKSASPSLAQNTKASHTNVLLVASALSFLLMHLLGGWEYRCICVAPYISEVFVQISSTAGADILGSPKCYQLN